HFRKRELSATLGRWATVDPIGFSGGDSNLYRVLSNNPIRSTDPLGLGDSLTPQVGYFASQSTENAATIAQAMTGFGLAAVGTGLAIRGGGGTPFPPVPPPPPPPPPQDGGCLGGAIKDLLVTTGAVSLSHFWSLRTGWDDKYLHCVVSCILGVRCGPNVSLAIGLTFEFIQELFDWFGSSIPGLSGGDKWDWVADRRGVGCANQILCKTPPRSSPSGYPGCHDCCVDQWKYNG